MAKPSKNEDLAARVYAEVEESLAALRVHRRKIEKEVADEMESAVKSGAAIAAVSAQISRLSSELRQVRKLEKALAKTIDRADVIGYLRACEPVEREEIAREAAAYDGEGLLA